MKCYYCSYDCQRDESKDVNAGTERKMQYWKCDRHLHEVTYLKLPEEQNKYGAFFYTCQYKNETYSIECYQFVSGNTQFLLMPVDKKDSPVVKHKADSPIVKLDFIPNNITPDNIDDKIQTLIVFS